MYSIKGYRIFLGVILVLSSVAFETFANYDKCAKIITEDGNLIFEAGLNGNITIRLKGKSRFIINDFDVLTAIGINKWINNTESLADVNSQNYKDVQAEITGLKIQMFGTGGLLSRIVQLENRTRTELSSNQLRRNRQKLVRLEGIIRRIQTKLGEDNCKNAPCQNGGTCIDLFDNFLCKCAKEWQGPTCSEDVNECFLYSGTDLGCQNGAICNNHKNGYSCICQPGWVGIHCNQRQTDCLRSSTMELCGHGTCVNTNDAVGYKCICDQGWKTNGLAPACTVDVDECTEYTQHCASHCINTPGSFMCSPCGPGYTGNGFTCKEIDECAINNGGCSTNPMVACINTLGSYRCAECPFGWTGDGKICTQSEKKSCPLNTICHPRASCEMISNTEVCTCPHGMIGNGIGSNGCVVDRTTKCYSNPCLNGGSCVETPAGFHCVCPPGYVLPFCTEAPNVCASNPCQNNGICRQNGDTYRCSCPDGYSGRNCVTQTNRCGGVLGGQSGHLKYPPSENYGHNLRCAWVIRTNVSQVLNVTFSSFNLEQSMDCRFDWLQIHDGGTSASQLVGRFCGNRLPKGGNIITTRNQIYFWFRSDATTSRDGFELSWNSIDPICGGTLEITGQGTIQSPGSPGNYPPNRDCKWLLRAPNNKRIMLTFFSMELEKHDNCNHDFLAIYDGITTEGILLEKFCNSSHPAPFTIPSNEVLLHFHSDNEGSDTGFQLHYSLLESVAGCGGTFTARSGEIESPNLNDGEISCEYRIRLAKGVRIHLEFLKFKMGTDSCFQIFDGPKDNHRFVGRWCNDLNPPDYESNTNEILLKFHSNDGLASFKLSYFKVCEFIFEDPVGVITSPNYPNEYHDNQDCSYEIRLNVGKKILLNFVDFQLEETLMPNTCSFDFLEIYDGYNTTAVGQYCGTQKPSNYVSTTNLLQLRFHSDSNRPNRGFNATYSVIDTGDCGGILKNENYHIKPPMDLEQILNYKSDVKCIWTIVAPKGLGIELSWLSFNIEGGNNCLFDYVEIYENYTNAPPNSIGKYCGREIPSTILFHNNMITIIFESDASDSGEGFDGVFRFVDVANSCNGNYFSSFGTIYSPNWVNGQVLNANCTWIINAPTNRQIEILVKSFDIEGGEGNYLEIRNGGTASSPLVGIYSNETIPSRIPSLTHQMYLNFIANSVQAIKRFEITWESTSTGCGGILVSPKGSITSPGYPQPYHNNAECEWHIITSEGSSIEIQIIDLHLENLMNCNFDYLNIYDGSLDTCKRIGHFCKKEDNDNVLVQTTESKALVRLVTDSSISERGFFLSYSTRCNNDLKKLFGVIESPNYPNSFPLDLQCQWNITAPKGNLIAVHFVHFDLFDSLGYTSNENASFPQLTFKNIQNDKILNLQNYTQYAPKSFNSTTNKLVINFQSPSSTEGNFGAGFRLEYEIFGCVDKFSEPSGSIKSPQYPNMYPNDIECIWTIQVEMGKAIQLKILDLDIEETKNCTNDGLKIWNGDKSEGHILGLYCGKKSNITITSSSHILVLKMYTNLLIRSKGFQAEYKTVDLTCGGVFSAPSGIILSPNYPSNYDNNLLCEWMIEVAYGHTIAITFEEFDMEQSYECQSDSIVLYEGSNIGTENILLRHCGDELPTPETWSTKENKLLIVMTTDFDTEMKGFKLSYKQNCGQRIVVNDTGRIYLQNVIQDQNECIWTLVADDPSNHVTFTTTHVSLTPKLSVFDNQMSKDCQSGVRIYDGTSAINVKPRIEFCDDHAHSIISYGSALTIQINLDVIGEFEGSFSILDNQCGGKLTSIRGKIASPLYPSSYPLNTECVWKLVATDGNSIDLSIGSIDLEQSDHCNEDYLEIRELNENGKLLNLLCGNEMPNMISGTGGLWIKFRSDEQTVGMGFLANYQYSQNNEITGSKGQLFSPSYPKMFISNGSKYSWRISVERGFLIVLSIKYVNEQFASYTKFYDGYDETALTIDFSNMQTIISNTNVLYITSTHGSFHFDWHAASKDSLSVNLTKIKDDDCSDNLITLGLQNTNIESPGYPNGYASNLRCNWILRPETIGGHAVIKFKNINLESEFCIADYLEIFKSTDMITWSSIKTICKLSSDDVTEYHGEPYLKLNFVTDYSSNGTGFNAIGYTVCGSTIIGTSGTMNLTGFYRANRLYREPCVLKVNVRLGRKIQLHVDTFEMGNLNNNLCRNYLLIKNGIDEDAPNLGRGKFCNKDELKDLPETSSNYVYIKFIRSSLMLINLSIAYEETDSGCSKHIQLTDNLNSTIITSPNYPNIPSAHIECIWTITAPINKILTINFLDKFSLGDCSTEYVQLNDGGTELSKTIGKYCLYRPDTQFTSGNILRVKYFTNLIEPNIGFKAEISVGKCGGTYNYRNGTINSPILSQLNLNNNKNRDNITCDYRIIHPPGFTIDINLESVYLPKSFDCSTDDHLEILLIINGNEIVKNTTICSSLESPMTINTNFNEVIIRYIIFSSQVNSNRFKLKYTSKYQGCSYKIEAENGVGQTPGYPNGISSSFCTWEIIVPKGRRVLVNFLDIDVGSDVRNTSRLLLNMNGLYRYTNFIEISNPSPKFLYRSDPTIVRTSDNNISQSIISSDNKIRITSFISRSSTNRGFKFNFTSIAGLFCVGNLNTISGEIRFPNEHALVCSYDVNVENGETITMTFKNYQSNLFKNNLAIWSPKYNKIGLDNISNILSLPFSFSLNVFEYFKIFIPFTMSWKRHKCGNIINIPSDIRFSITHSNNTHDGEIDCAWQLLTEENDYAHISIEITTNLKLNCIEEYLIIRNGALPDKPQLGRYCLETNLTKLIAINGVFIEYHTSNYSSESKFEISVERRGDLGGEIKYPFRDIEIRKEYKNNVELIWTIIAPSGYHIRMSFVDRFYIEQSINCTKDYLKIQEQIDGEWKDMQRLCGRNIPEAYNSTGEKVRLIFRSDDDIVGDGFKIKFDRFCGKVYYVDREETYEISSPNYPKNYDNNLRCNYKLIAKHPGDIIVLKTETFYLAGSIRACSDNVTIWYNDGLNDLHETFCRQNSPGEIRSTKEMTIEFLTNKYWTRSGFQFKYSIEKCGGEITTPGVISSPKQPKTNKYPPNLHCQWNITAPIDHKILIKFELISFEYSYFCSYDFIEVFAGKLPLMEKRKVKLCGNLTNTIAPIGISDKYAIIHSVTDNNEESEGFSAIVTFPEQCDKDITIAPSTTYNLNKFSHQYNNSLHCNYIFRTQPGYQLQIKFQSFHIENCTDCSCDYVELRDGTGPFADLIGRFCGHEIPENILTTKSRAFLVFSSDISTSSNGFEATVSSVPTLCGSHSLEFKDNKNITIISPGERTYLPNLNCYWHIVSDTTIHVHFEKLDLQEPNRNGTCENDFLEIYDDKEHDKFEDNLGSDLVVNGKRKSTDVWSFLSYSYVAKHIYCGNYLPGDYYTNSEKLFVRFLTDSSIERSGFKLIASRVEGCFRNFTNTQGRISLSTTKDCDIYITAPENYTLSLYYNNIYISGIDCTEFIEVYDMKNSKVLKKHCSFITASDNIYSNTNQLRLRTKFSGLLTHFELTYLGSKDGVGCGGDLFNYQGTISSPFYPDNARNHSDCRWNIQVPNNHKVFISFLVFDLGSKVTCGSDYVQLIEKDVVKRTFCGEDNPGFFIAQSNKLTVRFRKTVNFDGTGWQLEFRSANNDVL